MAILHWKQGLLCDKKKILTEKWAKCVYLHVCYQALNRILYAVLIFVAFVEDNATMTSIRYFENHVSYFVQNRRK